MFDFELYKKEIEFDEDLLIEPDIDDVEYDKKRKKRRRGKRLTKKELRTLYSYIG